MTASDAFQNRFIVKALAEAKRATGYKSEGRAMIQIVVQSFSIAYTTKWCTVSVAQGFSSNQKWLTIEMQYCNWTSVCHSAYATADFQTHRCKSTCTKMSNNLLGITCSQKCINVLSTRWCTSYPHFSILASLTPHVLNPAFSTS